MFFHLPIAIMATFSPVAVTDAVPKFDIVKECRFEGGSTATFDQCSRDEAVALERLELDWLQFASADKRSCLSSATIAGFASYVDLLTCLEMSRDAKKLGR